MISRQIVILLLLVTIISSPLASGQTWQEKFDRVESLIESGETTSAVTLFEEALSAEENQYSRSDSTVEVKFCRDGVSFYRAYRSFADAEQLYSKAVVLSEELYGPQSGELAYRLEELGAVYITLGRYREAESTFRRALQIARQAFGESSAETIECLNELGDILVTLSRYNEADSVAQEALRIIEMTGQSGSLLEARNLSVRGRAYFYFDAFADAEQWLERCLRIREETLGPEHLDVAACLRLLASCYRRSNKAAKAEAASNRSLQLVEATFGPNHVETAFSLRGLGSFVYGENWQFQQGEELYARAVTILEKAYGRTHPETASTILSLAGTYRSLTRYAEAETLAEEILPSLQESLGHNHATVIRTLGLLSDIDVNMNRLVSAIDYLERALLLLEERGETDRLLWASNQFSLGDLYFRAGNKSAAEAAYLKAVPVYEKSARPTIVVYLLSTLANLYLNYDRLDESYDLYKKCLRIVEEQFPPGHPLEVYVLHGLAFCELERGNVEKAKEYMTRQVELSARVFGVEDAELGQTLRSAGNFYKRAGEYKRAEELLLEAQRVYNKSVGPDHDASYQTIYALASLYNAQRKFDQTLRCYRDLYAYKQRRLQAIFGAVPESDRLVYLDAFSPILWEAFPLALVYDTVPSRELALEMTLKGKAMLEEASMAARRAAYCSNDSGVVAMLQRLSRVRTLTANEILSGSSDREGLTNLYVEQDSLEEQISRKCLGFEQDLALRNFAVRDVASALPEDAILIEFLDFGPMDIVSDSFIVTGSGKYVCNYGALTLNHRGETSIFDFGSDESIDSLIASVRRMIYESQPLMYSTKAAVAEEKLADSTALLRKLIFDPLVEKLDGKTRLFISGDGMLNLLPFEILATDDGGYLAEKYRITYLTSGRDLLRYRQESESSDNVVVMADPDFDNAAPSSRTGSPFSGDTPPSMVQLLRSTGSCLDGPISRLNYSLDEGRRIANSFRERTSKPVAEWYGTDASEDNLKALEEGPGVLHIATHGYFCSDPDDDSAVVENPLIRSGLTLAGYNRTVSHEGERVFGQEDGILTAYEVSGLNLSGTELVTLSACESGIEEGFTVKGLYGLRRAFQHAGAQTVVMSLWRVPDRETSQLMKGFYVRWLSGSTKHDALRDSALELLQRCRKELGCGHPLLWGGFVLTGSPD